MGMIDKDRLIKALEYCDENYSCIGCPYSGLTSEKEIVKCKANHDAVILLRGQENLADCHDVLVKYCDYLLAELKKRPEIIRCEDCTWNTGTKEKPFCQVFSMGTREDWFCADGKRWDDDA